MSSFARRHNSSYRLNLISGISSLTSDLKHYIEISESAWFQRPNFFSDDSEFSIIAKLESSIFQTINSLTAITHSSKVANALQMLSYDITDYAISFMGLEGRSSLEMRSVALNSLKNLRVEVLRELTRLSH